MTTEERLVADYSGTGVTVGHHPMAYRREELRRRRILSAEELQVHHDGAYVRAAGCVIARQRPERRRDLSSSPWKMKPES